MKITKKVIFTLFILGLIWACTDDAKQFLTDVDGLDQLSTEGAGDATFGLMVVGESSTPVSNGGITPFIIDGAGVGGNRTCEEVATAFGLAEEFTLTSSKINYVADQYPATPWEVEDEQGNKTYFADFPDPYIEVTVTDGTYVSWSFTPPEGECLVNLAAIVKGSSDANVYYYMDGIYSDDGLASPVNASGSPAGLSNLTFCYTLEPCDNGDECTYETAWTEGDRYVTKGNWATYTSYEGAEKTVDLLAGQDMLAGTVTFSVPAEGMVTITINFEDGWELQDVEEPLKVQDYAIAPTSKPSPGLFDWKNETNTIVVPENNFYGVHVDVQNCPPPPCNEWIVYGSNLNAGSGPLDDAIYAYDLNAQTQTLVYDPTPIDESPNYPNANAYDPVNQRIYCGTDDGRIFYYDIDDALWVPLKTNENFGVMACGAWYDGKFYYVQNGTNRLYEVVIADVLVTATRTQIGTVPTSNGYGDIAFDPANPGVFIGSAGSNPVWYIYDLNTSTSQVLSANVTDNHKQLAYGSNGILYAVNATSGQFYTVVYDTGDGTVTLTADWYSPYTFTDLASGPQCQ